VIFIAAMIASAQAETVAILSAQSQRAYLACVEDHLPAAPKEMSIAKSLSAPQRDLANKAVEACDTLRSPAVSYAVYLRSLRQTTESAFNLRLRVEDELSNLVEGRLRSSFNIGWVH
jgi:hypothetical protein